jgi:nucleoporin NUP159
MAFSSFGNTGAATAGAAPSVQAGPDLGDIQTEVGRYMV